MPAEENVGNLYQYLIDTSAKLALAADTADFLSIPTTPVSTTLNAKEITGNLLGRLSAGYLDTRFGKLVYKNRQERDFIEACVNNPQIRHLTNCQISIPFINEAGKFGKFTPSFYLNVTQIVDVVNVVNAEQRFRNFWVQEYLKSDAELNKLGLSYSTVLLDEQASDAETNRPSFHKIFMDFAKSVAARSVSQKLQVGSVITSADCNIIFSFGYNGDERGGSNRPVLDDTGQHEDTVHAEINSIIKLDFNSPQDKVLYVTHSPCLKCARAIINANIKLVLYGEVYKNTAGVDLLRNRGVRVVKYTAKD